MTYNGPIDAWYWNALPLGKDEGLGVCLPMWWRANLVGDGNDVLLPHIIDEIALIKLLLIRTCC